MSPVRALALLACALACSWQGFAWSDDLGVSVPSGFEVSLYADDALAHDIFSMTIDAQGRVVVAGPAYVKILHDDDHDGRADRATLFSTVPQSGAHGMFFDGPDLICTGDNSVMRLRDANRDDVADGPGEIWTSLRHPEHGANGLVRGPDGSYYLICGNDAGVAESLITVANSPIKHPRSGAVVRFSATGKPLDVFADGFRNPYDLDFDAAGHLLTVDSDGERDHHLPWYAPTRLFDVAQGMEHGWLLSGHTRGWNRPASFFDNVERIVEIGRGSPTGVAVYRHTAFPTHYRSGVFSACWTLGRVYYFPLTPSGATSRGTLEVFMQTSGDVGFAPCDLAVGPDGDLFVAIGGRHTRGSVFRVRATERAHVRNAAVDPLDDVLSADQPLASWSRARWVPRSKELGRLPLEQAAEDEKRPVQQRIRAIEILVELLGGVSTEQAVRLAACSDAAIRARLAWALGGQRSPTETQQILVRLTSDSDARVARASWESLATVDSIDPASPGQPDWGRALTTEVRRVRAAAIAVARGVGSASYQKFAGGDTSATNEPAKRLGHLWIRRADSSNKSRPPALSENDLKTCLQCFADRAAGPRLQLESVRLLQIGLGDLRIMPGQAEVYAGYTGNASGEVSAVERNTIVAELAPAFPTTDAELNRELARLFGMLAPENGPLLAAISRRWSERSSVEDDLHYLIVASLFRGVMSDDVRIATASALLRLHGKLDEQGHFVSRNWPLRVGELFQELREQNPALAGEVADSALFGHAQHTLFAMSLQRESRDRATRRLWARGVADGREPTPALVNLVGRLPEVEARPLLDSIWDQAGLRDSIVLALARHPQPSDRSKFIEALASPQPTVIEKAAQALVTLGVDSSPSEMAAAITALKLACLLPQQSEPRKSLWMLLDFWSEGCADLEDEPDVSKAYVPWIKLFAQLYPHESARLGVSAGADVQTWKARLAQIDWTRGDAARGRGVFERRACHRCHQDSGQLGPELKGAVSRLSRDDLFTAIIDPNLEVSPAFQTTVIATRSGQVYHGLVVYESPEGILLQTGPDTTVRITDADESSARKSARSLMPTGLLDPLGDEELSDLYAFLRTLGSK